MDLNDSFTEKLLQRSKARREYITVKKSESPNVVSKKRPVLIEEPQISNQGIDETVTDDSPKRQRLSMPSEDREYEKENIDMEDDREESFVPFKASSNRGLAALRNKHTDSSNDEEITNGAKSEAEVNTCRTYVFSTNGSELCSTRKTRLANLAANINQWEDNLQSTHTTNNVTSSAPNKFPTSSRNFPLTTSTSNVTSVAKSFDSKLQHINKVSNDTSDLPYNSKMHVTFKSGSGDFVQGSSKAESSHSRMPPVFKEGNVESSADSCKQIKRLGVWDQAVKAALESDEIVKSPLKKSLNDPRDKEMERESSAEESEDEQPDFVNDCKPKINNIPKIQHDNILKSDVLDKSFDPAELPLSARKALFEKALTGGNVAQPAVPPEKLSVAQRAAMFETASKTNSKPKLPSHSAVQKGFGTLKSSPTKIVKTAETQPSPAKTVCAVPYKGTDTIPKTQGSVGSPVKKIVPATTEYISPSKNVGIHTRHVQQQLVKSASTNWQQKEIAVAGERKTEISNLVNHWEKLSSSSSAENRISEEEPFQKPQRAEEVFESEEEEADYESDIESEYTEREYDSEWNEKSEIGNPKDFSQYDPEVSDSEEEVFNPKRFSADAGLSNFDVETDCTTDNDAMSYTEPHQQYKNNYNSESSEGLSSKSSVSEPNSYSVSKSQSGSSGGSTSSNRAVSERSERDAVSHISSTSSDAPLCHTVSFYRKQKQVTRTPPLQTIVRREPVMEVPEEDNQAEMIQERIKLLQDEILRQQTVISQTSQALNLCHATAEFSGSTEQVEGERLLLIATQKRQACLNEIQRLKSHGAQGLNVADGSGTLTISDIQLPLKREFISAQLEGKLNDAVHCFLCLIRHGPQVIVTQMVSTNDKITDGSLCFTNHIKLQNLPPDFSVVFEVYALQTKKEVLPHEKKYHIKKEHSKVRLTPKGKKGEGKLLFPGVSSPGGPNAVRSPSFAVIGFTRFTIQNNNKKCFTLDKVPFTSPLEGVLKVKLHLHAEHKVIEKGFLTMFEDVSGFGAWHRRWCSLDSHHLAYWKYPDDEAKKEPIGTIDLKQCVTSQVKLVSRDICARPHTFQLLIVRPHAKGDKNTLISQSADTLTSTKHLISADTKEERVAWCNKLNEALANLRKWDPRALRPIEDKQE